MSALHEFYFTFCRGCGEKSAYTFCPKCADPEESRCPHGEPLGDCHTCDVEGDLAFDADREG